MSCHLAEGTRYLPDIAFLAGCGYRLRIYWFYEFESSRIRLEAGWCPYGRERITGQPWSQPLLVGQDRPGG